MKTLITLIDNRDNSKKVTAMIDQKEDIIKVAKNKLRSSKVTILYTEAGTLLGDGEMSNGMTLYVSCGEPYQGPKVRSAGTVRVIANKSVIESAARDELHKVATLPGVISAVGMPDLHAGPTGCAVVTGDCIYPHLAGSDIGCGVALFKAGKMDRFNVDKMLKHVQNIRPMLPDEIREILDDNELQPTCDDHLLGTIGYSNHFSEFMEIDTVSNPTAFVGLGLDQNDLLLCVHSGSRHLGKSTFDKFGSKSISADRADDYFWRHDHAVKWARINRQTIAYRLLDGVPERIIDITHNSISQQEAIGQWDQCRRFVHRKGAAPTDKGAVVIPGSRGTYSYIVRPKTIDMDSNNFSIAHGAGRQLSRSKAKAKAVKRYGHELKALKTTEMGSHVYCNDLQTLSEEIPEAYKAIDDVIDDLAEYVDVIARLKPRLTVKDFIR